MTLEQLPNQIGDFIRKYKTILIIASIIFIYLAYTGKIPQLFSIQTMSIFGGGIATIGVGVALFVVGIILILIPEPVSTVVLGPIFLVGAYLIGGGAIITAIANLFESFIGWVIVAIIGFLVYVKLK